MRDLWDDLRILWDNFWFKWHSPPSHLIRYGGGPQGYKTFRKQRLFNILFGIGIILILIGLYFK